MLKRIEAYEIDHLGFQMLALQAAGTVLFICENRNPGVNDAPGCKPSELYDPIAVRIGEYSNWGGTSHTNALQSLVQVVYDYVTMCIEHPQHLGLLGEAERRLFADALATYQSWKTIRLDMERQQLGPGHENWKASTGFSTFDWTDLNPQLLGETAV